MREVLMAVRDPQSPEGAPDDGAGPIGGVELETPGDFDAAAVLRPLDVDEPAALRRHMDVCVAHAVRAGLCHGTALAAHASVIEVCGDDLARADAELVAALRRLLEIAPLTRQETR
jgi:hypothetical protein